jgi:hypothetical protein
MSIFAELKHRYMATAKLYDVKYYNKKGTLLETIAYTKPIALAKYIKRTKENTTHRNGVIKIKQNGRK